MAISQGVRADRRRTAFYRPRQQQNSRRRVRSSVAISAIWSVALTALSMADAFRRGRGSNDLRAGLIHLPFRLVPIRRLLESDLSTVGTGSSLPSCRAHTCMTSASPIFLSLGEHFERVIAV